MIYQKHLTPAAFKNLLIMLIFLYCPKVYSQTGLTLSVNDLLNWQTSTANQSNICSTPISHRNFTVNYQIAAGLDTNTKILYCPDGMNNFGPYVDSANQFNLFNFSHWQYIDILTWFGGSAATPIVIPAKAWVDAAHKNGVKVIGTVFFAPAVYGGTQAAMQDFLQLDASGNFIAANKLIEIANYYNFDGWFMNFETSVNSTTGSLASSFIQKLDSAYNGELIWYDAMLTNGSISYQNKLNANNAYFFEHSTGLFTNYNWTSANTVNSSATYATGLGLSPFNVYTGADMWPNRPAQPAFTNYTWIDKIITNGIAKTSVALFATNFTFNYAPFSTFNNDPTDYNNFYSTERKIFSGIDEDPFITDSTWKGLAQYVPVRTTITSLPFETDFNTGHGLNYYLNGTVLVAGPWHNMSHQSILPSWTFYGNGITMSYDFNDSYSGGSSLAISSSTGGNFHVSLFSTDFVSNAGNLNTKIAIKSASNNSIDSVSVELKKKNGSLSAFSIFHPALNGNWEDLTAAVSGITNNDTIISIDLNIYSSGAFSLNCGRIKIDSTLINSVANHDGEKSLFTISPNPSKGIVEAFNKSNVQGTISIFDLKGARVFSSTIKENSTLQINLPGDSVYLYEFKSELEFRQGKLIEY